LILMSLAPWRSSLLSSRRSRYEDKPVPRLLWNASASVPIGLYSVEPINKLAVTNLVVAMPPNPFATFFAERGYRSGCR
jgi:type IV secretory pathway protease TraF